MSNASTRARVGIFVLLLGLLCATVSFAQSEPSFPTLSARVVDQANIIPAEDEAALTIDLEALERKSTDQLVVVTLASLQGYAIEDYGYRLGRHWGIGQEGKDNGVLLIVAPTERKVRIEVGRRLEPILTDALTKLIIENAVLPRFRAGDFPGGIKAGVRDIVDSLTGDAEAVRLRAEKRPEQNAEWVTLLVVVIWFAIFAFVMWNIWRSARPGLGTAAGRRGGWSSGSAGGWGGGWSGGSGGWSGGSSGGGFSGGGGSFGGGGASGGW